MITDAEITPEQDDAALGHLALWAEVLKCAAEDVSGGIRIGALTKDLRATDRPFTGRQMEQAADALDALDFLRSHGAVRLCDMFHTDPGYVLRKCCELELRGPKSYIKAPMRDRSRPTLRVPKHDLTGTAVKTWAVMGLTGETTHEGCMWRCRCTGCGAERSYPTRRLRTDLVGMCPCQSKTAQAAAKRGARFAPEQCLMCGAPVNRNANGAPRYYCCGKCKSAAFHARKAEKRGAAQGGLTATPRG